ncbi:MAG: TolC family protein [Psychrobium sp.]
MLLNKLLSYTRSSTSRCCRFHLHKKPIGNGFKQWSLLSLAALSYLSVPAWSQDITAEASLSLNQAISKTMAQHPQLRSYQYAKQVADGQLQQAATATPYSINARVEDVLGSGEYRGLSGMQTSLSISWLLENDVIDSRIGVAKSQAQLSQFERQLTVLDVAADTATHFITLLSQQEQLSLAKLAQRTASDMLAQISRRVAVGQLTAIDELRAKANLSKKALVVEDLTHEIEATKAQLAAQWQGNTEFNVAGNLQVIPTSKQLDGLIKQLKNSPQFLHFAAQRQIMQSQMALAKTTAQPSWKFDVGIKRNEAIDDTGFTAGISIPFGGKNRNQGRIRTLNAQQRQNETQADAWYKQVSKELLLISHKIRHNSHVIEALSLETIPTLEQASNQAKKAYQIGSLRYSEWNDVQQDLITTQGELIEAYTNIALLNIELERLAGVSLSANK